MRNCGAPPGFISLTSFSLKKLENGEDSVIRENGAGKSSGEADEAPKIVNAELLKGEARRKRSWIVDEHIELSDTGNDTGDDFESLSSKASLPKGVLRGCPSCDNCLKVVARWQAEESCLPSLEEAPVFYPTEEEFKDTLNYVASIRPQAEQYGICRIVPPTSWKPPSLIGEKITWETFKFETQIQDIDELGGLFLKKRLHRAHLEMRSRRREISKTGLVQGSRDGDRDETDGVGCLSDIVEYESGPELTLQTFKNYADDFKSQYFSKIDVPNDSNASSTALKEPWEPSVQSIEGEYWRIIERPSEKLEVLYGASLDARAIRSEFPVKPNALKMPKHPLHVKSGWNLDNTSKLQGSLLRYENCSKSSVLYPQLAVGMCFSSNSWRIEEHYLYSLCYMHLGDPKIWYAVPQQHRFKFEETVKKRFPELSKHPWLLPNIAAQIPPSTLISEGIPVYRCVQDPMEFVVVFPGSCHSEFDCGFNCSEAVNFASCDWLPHGRLAVDRYSELHRKTSISYDKMLLGAAGVAIQKIRWNSVKWRSVCGKDGILTKALKARVKSEAMRQKHLCSALRRKAMDKDFDDTTKRECAICHYDLHLSAIGCECSPNRYTCLCHGELLCSCSWSSSFFLSRYEISELNSMVEALEGESNANGQKWPRKKLKSTPPSQAHDDQNNAICLD